MRDMRVYVGEDAWREYTVENDGDEAVAGFRAPISLPRHITFSTRERPQGCRYSTDSRVATCTYPYLPLIPLECPADVRGEAFVTVVNLL